MDIKKKVLSSIGAILKEDKKNIFYLVYYSMIEAVLVLSIPLATSFVINSVLAHASISIYILGFIVIIIFFLTTILQITKEYIIEKFQQKIFTTTGIQIAQKAVEMQHSSQEEKKEIDKFMNYFFDISSIQKFFPILLLDGTGLIVKIFVSLILLLAFDPMLFSLGLFFLIMFVIFLVILGKHGFRYSIERSNAKHNAIYFLQNIPYSTDKENIVLETFDNHLLSFIKSRERIFRVILRQLTLTFFLEGLLFSGFLIVGGYLVINGLLPIGEFVAAEIVLVSIIYALKSFMKHIDYIYDMVEGFYKIDMLTTSLSEKNNG